MKNHYYFKLIEIYSFIGHRFRYCRTGKLSLHIPANSFLKEHIDMFIYK